jgi:hypothetical protein
VLFRVITGIPGVNVGFVGMLENLELVSQTKVNAGCLYLVIRVIKRLYGNLTLLEKFPYLMVRDYHDITVKNMETSFK